MADTRFKKGQPACGRPFNTLTTEERKANAQKALETRWAKQRAAESIQETVNLMLKAKPNLTDVELSGFVKFVRPTMSNQEALIAVQMAKAIFTGDTKAAEFIRDSSGQKPTDNINLSGELSVEQYFKNGLKIEY